MHLKSCFGFDLENLVPFGANALSWKPLRLLMPGCEDVWMVQTETVSEAWRYEQARITGEGHRKQQQVDSDHPGRRPLVSLA